MYALLHIFINISDDHILGNNQMITIFWDTVITKYNKDKPAEASERD